MKTPKWLQAACVLAATFGLSASIASGGFGPAQGGGTTGGGSSPTSSPWSTVLGNGATTSGHTPVISTGDVLQIPDASSTTPAVAFTSQTSLGLYKDSSGTLGVSGGVKATSDANGYGLLYGQGAGSGVDLVSYAASGPQPPSGSNTFRVAFRRGTAGSPANAQSGDYLGGLTGVGTTNGANSVSIWFKASGAAGTNTIPTDIVFGVVDTSGADTSAVEALRLQAGGTLRSLNAGTSAPAVHALATSRGTVGSPTAVQSGDDLGWLLFQGFIGGTSQYQTFARVKSSADGTVTDATTAPGRWVVSTTPANDATFTPLDRWCVDSSGNLKGTSGLALGWTASSSDPTGSLDTLHMRVGANQVVQNGSTSTSSLPSLAPGFAVVSPSGGGAGLYAINFGSTGPFVAGYRAAGTQGSPTQTAADTILMQVVGRGYADNSAFATNNQAAIGISSIEAVTSTTCGGYVFVQACAPGSTSLQSRFRIDSTGITQTNTSPAHTWTSSGLTSGAITPNLVVYRDNANGRLAVAQNATGSAATLRVYGTTDANGSGVTNSDYVELVTAAAGAKSLWTNKSGTGTAGNLQLGVSGTNVMTIVGVPTASAATALKQLQGVNGSLVAWGVLHNNVTTSSGTSVNLGTQLPAGSQVLSVTYRITTTSGGAFGTSASFFSNFYAAANTFKIVSTSGTFTGGVVEVEIYYITVTAPTS